VARDEPVVRPARTDEWQIVAADKGVAEEWNRWAKQEPNALAAAYDKLATDPTEFSSGQRKLEGKTMGTGVYEGKALDRWQYEVTSGRPGLLPRGRSHRGWTSATRAQGPRTEATPPSHHRSRPPRPPQANRTQAR
jgi:hypothetical protein